MAFKVEGLDGIIRKLRKLPDNVGNAAVARAIPEALKVIQDEIQLQAPVDTGALRASVTVERARRKKDTVRGEVTIDSVDFKGKTYYAAFIEFGDAKMPANAFARRAFEGKKEEARDRAIELINESLDKEVT